MRRAVLLRAPGLEAGGGRRGGDRRALERFYSAHGLARLPIFIFTTESGSDKATCYSRMFAPGSGIVEDPATGGASGPLGSYLVHHGVLTPQEGARIVSLQGKKMGRPSWIHIDIGTSDGAIERARRWESGADR